MEIAVCIEGSSTPVSLCSGLQDADGWKVKRRKMWKIQKFKIQMWVQILVCASHGVADVQIVQPMLHWRLSGVSPSLLRPAGKPACSHRTRKYKTNSHTLNSWCQIKTKIHQHFIKQTLLIQVVKKKCICMAARNAVMKARCGVKSMEGGREGGLNKEMHNNVYKT